MEQNSESVELISSASDLWSSLVESGALRPDDYDADLADLVRKHYGETGDIEIVSILEERAVSAQELFAIFEPEFSAFVGMLADLLSLYSRIGAQSASCENLNIEYEFSVGQREKFSLHDFKKAIDVSRKVLLQLKTLQIPEECELRWSFPKLVEPSSEREREISKELFGYEFSHRRFSTEYYVNFQELRLPKARNSQNQEVVDKAQELLDLYIAVLRSPKDDCEVESCKSVTSDQDIEPGSWIPRSVYIDLTDFWLERVAVNLFAIADSVNPLPEDLKDEFEVWCQSFIVKSSTQLVEKEILIEFLSLPQWGRRHELYSAWILTGIDEALKDWEIAYKVDPDGKLAFPFGGALIGTLGTPEKQCEIWCELRTKTEIENLHGGRKKGVQPDYQIICKSHDEEVQKLIIEVKQYKRASGKKHNQTASDYARVFEGSDVFLVAYGPIGKKNSSILDESESRVHFFEHTQPRQRENVVCFEEEIQEYLRGYLPVKSWKALRLTSPSTDKVFLAFLQEAKARPENLAECPNVIYFWTSDAGEPIEVSFDQQHIGDGGVFQVFASFVGSEEFKLELLRDSNGAEETLQIGRAAIAQCVSKPAGLIHVGTISGGVFTTAEGTYHVCPCR